MNKALSFGEKLLFTILWIVGLLIIAGVALHFANSKGWVPAPVQKVLAYTNLSQQAG